MKRITYVSAVLALLVFSGCADKEPTIDTTKNVSGNSSIDQMPSASKDTGAVIAPITTASSVDTNANASGGVNGAGGQGIVSIYFDYDKFEIREDMQAHLKTNGGLVKIKPSSLREIVMNSVAMSTTLLWVSSVQTVLNQHWLKVV
jgi:peptidoglycan-associated lipoprotein